MRVGEERYALPVENVLEVAEFGRPTLVPGAPPETLGVRNLRGEALPVFDLAAVLGIAREGTPTRLVVTEDRGRRVGFAIDEVRDVGELPGASEETDSPFLTAAVLTSGGLIGVVDLGVVLDRLAQGSAT
jgi:purine-binding chemotaxis protein CheW